MTQAEVLPDRNPPILVVQLTREGPYAVPTAQAGYICICDIITCLALRVLCQLLGAGINFNVSFTTILQGLAESFVQFLDCTNASHALLAR